MKITRHFTTDSKPVQEQIEWKLATAKISGAGFEMRDIEVPRGWSQTAINILAQKYFRKAGVPQSDTLSKYITEDNIPIRLRRTEYICGEFGSETSAKQVFHRLAGHWTYVGWKHGYFDSETDARAFYDELYFMLATQMGAPNSPQWFNTGLWWAYGIAGPDSGQWAVDYFSKPSDPRIDFPRLFQPGTSYEFPQPHACFIQPVNDDLVNAGGIMDLAVREVRLFKHGSGTGTNFSSIRAAGEPLSGGGRSSGLMSFLEILDRAAGAIKSGGTTRRAAKMVCLDLDHPEIEDFINWKVREEAKAAAMYVGSKIYQTMDDETGPLFPEAILDRFRHGIDMEEFGIDWEGEAIRTVSGQNSNNSVRVPDKFLAAVDNNNVWRLQERTTGKYVKEIAARELWNQICRAAWASADPGVQFDDTINAWNTCAQDGRINASNPCGEYNFLDNTACNLASLNLVKFLKFDGTFDVESFAHATRLWTIVLDISVSMASFPSREIALGSYNYRTLGLGYANVGGLLMRSGMAYDSAEGRDYIASITALMHGVTYKTSAELAAELGPFPRWEANKKSMSKVIGMHKSAARTMQHSASMMPLYRAIDEIWNGINPDSAFRNAQTTLIAPTGTIALLMDCDTTGIEPEFSLKKTKLMVGGGVIETINHGVEQSLRHLDYKEHEINLILNTITCEGSIENAPCLKPEHLPIFDCSIPPSSGSRFLSPMAHVKMVAVVQPFLSGAVSKTVNLPNSATIADIDRIYREAHRLGIKSIALYRDGSKLTQPLNVKESDAGSIEMEKFDAQSAPDVSEDIEWARELAQQSANIKGDSEKQFLKNTLEHLKSRRGVRHRLNARRSGYTQKVKINGQSFHLRTGEYDDGTLGEIWLDFQRNGSTLGGILNALAKSISIGLQYGVPLDEFVDSFVHTKFEPAGIVQDHDRIKLCASLIDFVFRDLAISYLDASEYANIKEAEDIQSEEWAGEFMEEGGTITKEAWNELKSKIPSSPLSNDSIADLIEHGYRPSGDVCTICGGQMIQSGTCKICVDCGESSGGCG